MKNREEISMKDLWKRIGMTLGATAILSSQVLAVVIIPKGNPNSYTDIANHWATDAMRYVITEGYFKGESSTEFLPEEEMSRAMLCTVLWRLTGEELTRTTVTAEGNVKIVPRYVKKFWDMKEEDWYTNYISWANKNDIINGYTEREFRPDESVTREQVAVIFHNYLKNYKLVRNFDIYLTNEPITYTDEANIADWAKEQVAIMQQIGLMNGRPDGSFDPQGTVTRAEVAVMIQRLVAWIAAR